MKYLAKNRIYLAPFLIFILFSVIWLYLRQFDLELTRNYRQLWGATYQILALYGAIAGLTISKKWGGYKSLFGKAILLFSIGLLLQCFGQTYSSYYVYFYNVESPPYPAIGDAGFFGSIVAYIYGVVLLSRVMGSKFSLKETGNKVLAVVIPLVVVVFSYIFFLKDYEFDWSDKLKVFLDFGYPLGQAIYVSIAILAFILSKNILGGIMKKPLWFLIFALVFQYFSDAMFLYEASAGSWYVGNINDYLYAASYFIMTFSLLQLGVAFSRIKDTP